MNINVLRIVINLHTPETSSSCVVVPSSSVLLLTAFSLNPHIPIGNIFYRLFITGLIVTNLVFCIFSLILPLESLFVCW